MVENWNLLFWMVYDNRLYSSIYFRNISRYFFKMNPEKCKKTRRARTKHITIRINEDVSNWLKKNHFSPTAIFQEAIKELGYRRQK